jgi:ribosome maturation factor RimP
MNLIDELKAALNRDIKNLGYTLWGLEVSGKHNSRHIRVFIDNENSSITLKDCEKVNIQAREVLENSDSLEFSYSLEISSPGIDRTFFEIEQLKAYVGEEIQVKFEADSHKQTVLGKLISISEDFIEIENLKKGNLKISLDNYLTSKLIYKA